MRNGSFAVGCCLLCIPLLGACGDDDDATAPLVAVDRISITSPKTYQTYQRDENGQADISMSGTYTGTPTAIEAQFNGGGWSTIDASPSGGSFSGAFSSQSGQGTLKVHFTNDHAVTASVTSVGIGDVFLVAGQSSASGRGINSQAYAHSSLKASMYREDEVWAELTDPTDAGRCSRRR